MIQAQTDENVDEMLFGIDGSGEEMSAEGFILAYDHSKVTSNPHISRKSHPDYKFICDNSFGSFILFEVENSETAFMQGKGISDMLNSLRTVSDIDYKTDPDTGKKILFIFYG